MVDDFAGIFFQFLSAIAVLFMRLDILFVSGYLVLQIYLRLNSIKRVVDISFSILLLVILFPLLLISLLISLLETQSFPIYTQMRGLSIDNPLFKMYKIRTIKMSDSNGQNTGRRFLFSPGLKEKVPNGCKVLRRFGIDELPQLVNVIRGEMSIVGPRPLDTFDLKIMKTDYTKENGERSKLKSKPGIIGLWQINGSRYLGAENILYWDKTYDMNKSLEYDLKILLGGILILYNNKKEDSILHISTYKSTA